MSRMYVVHVKFLDEGNTPHTVSSSYVTDLNPPAFESKKVYNVFWSGDKDVSLESFKKGRREIPVFKQGSGNLGPGYYPAHVIHIAESEEELNSFLGTKEARRVISRGGAPFNRGGSSSSRGASTSRGGTSNCSSSTSSHCGDSGRGSVRSRFGNGKKTNPNSSNTVASSSKGSDEESEDSDSSSTSDSSGTEGKSNKQFKKLKRKNKKLKRKNSSLKAHCDSVLNENRRLRKLNIEYQEEKSDRLREDHNCCCLYRGNSKTAHHTDQSVARRVINNDLDHDRGDMMDTTEDNVTIDIEPDNIINNEGDQIQILAGRDINGDPVQIHPQVEVLINDDLRLGGEPAMVKMDKDHDILISQDLWDGRPEFKRNVVDAVKKIKDGTQSEKYYGEAGDSIFIRDAALAMWGTGTLVTHTVSGKHSNANKRRDLPEPFGPLPENELSAICSALQLRIAVEYTKPIPDGRRDQPSAKNRLGKVRYEVGQKIASLRKSVAGKKILQEYQAARAAAAPVAPAANGDAEAAPQVAPQQDGGNARADPAAQLLPNGDDAAIN